LLIVVGLVGIVAAIAIPGLLRARMSGNEASALASLRAINSSQQAYSVVCSNRMFAASLETLGVPPVNGGAAFISPDLSSSIAITKSGFTITMAGTPAPATTPMNCQGYLGGANQAAGYHATATALDASTGGRSFWTNASGTVYQKPEDGSPFMNINDFGPPDAGGAVP